MPVLFTGHEIDAFAETTSTDVTSVIPTTNAGKFDPDFSRSIFYSAGSVATRGRSAKVNIPATAEGWIGFRLYVGANTIGGVIVAAYTADDVSSLFDLNSASGVLSIRGATSDAARTVVSPGASLVGTNSYFINAHWKAVSGGMLLELFVNGALIATATVSNAYLNGKSVGIIRIGGAALGTSANVNAGYGWYYSEIIVSTEDNRGWRVATLVPTAAGTTSDWDGTFADIDEAEINDADYISSDVANEVSLFGMSNLSVAAQNMDVKAVALTARARKGVTGPLNIQVALRSGGANYFTANRTGLNTAFGPLESTMWENNPATAAPFTVSEVQGIELGFKSTT